VTTAGGTPHEGGADEVTPRSCSDACMDSAHQPEEAEPLWLRVPPEIQPLMRSGDVLMQTLGQMSLDLAALTAPPLVATGGLDVHAAPWPYQSRVAPCNATGHSERCAGVAGSASAPLVAESEPLLSADPSQESVRPRMPRLNLATVRRCVDRSEMPDSAVAAELQGSLDRGQQQAVAAQRRGSTPARKSSASGPAPPGLAATTIPESIAALLQRTNWLRSELHDPHCVLLEAAAAAAAAEDRAFRGRVDAPGDCSQHLHAVQLHKLAAGANMRADSSSESPGALVHSIPAADTSCAQSSGSVTDCSMPRSVGDFVRAFDAVNDAPPAEGRTRSAAGSGLHGRLIAFKKRNFSTSANVVIELPTKRNACHAGKLARFGHRDILPLKAEKVKTVPQTPRKAVTDACESNTGGGSEGDGNRAARRSNGTWRRHVPGCACVRGCAESPDKTPHVAIQVPDFDSEHGFTQGFYDPETYTMYIM
jgi:hypothetical protein